MADLLIRPARLEDAAQLANTLRQADRDEVIATVGNDDIEAALRISIAASFVAYAAERTDNGTLIAVGGSTPLSLLGGMACPWLLGTDEVYRRPGSLTRYTLAHIADVRRDYPVLINYVDARNTKSICWLKRIGFTIYPAAPHGAAGLPFHRFEMR